MNLRIFQQHYWLLLLLLPSWSGAQSLVKAVDISVLNEAVTIPSHRIVQPPIHPGLRLGATLWTQAKGHWQNDLGAELSYYYHEWFEHALLVNGCYSIGYAFEMGLQPKFEVAAGYKQSFLSDEAVFRFEKGQYEPVILAGKAQLNLQVGLGLEYALTERWSLSLDYRAMAVYPYAPQKGLAAISHSLLALGLEFHFN